MLLPSRSFMRRGPCFVVSTLSPAPPHRTDAAAHLLHWTRAMAVAVPYSPASGPVTPRARVLKHAARRANKALNQLSAPPVTAAVEESRQAAKTAGLRYVSDRSPGISRQRVGSRFRYVTPQGRTSPGQAGASAHPIAGDTAGVDRRLGLCTCQRSPAGHRARCPGTEAVSVPQPLANGAGREQVPADPRVRRGAAGVAEADRGGSRRADAVAHPPYPPSTLGRPPVKINDHGAT